MLEVGEPHRARALAERVERAQIEPAHGADDRVELCEGGALDERSVHLDGARENRTQTGVRWQKLLSCLAHC